MAHDQMHFIKLNNWTSQTLRVYFSLAMSDLLQKICAPQDLSLTGTFKASKRFSIRSYPPFWHFSKKAIGWHGFVNNALTSFMWDFSLNFLKDYFMTLVVYIFSVYPMMMARDWLNFPSEMSLLEDSYPPNYSLTTSTPNQQQKK